MHGNTPFNLRAQVVESAQEHRQRLAPPNRRSLLFALAHSLWAEVFPRLNGFLVHRPVCIRRITAATGEAVPHDFWPSLTA